MVYAQKHGRALTYNTFNLPTNKHKLQLCNTHYKCTISVSKSTPPKCSIPDCTNRIKYKSRKFATHYKLCTNFH